MPRRTVPRRFGIPPSTFQYTLGAIDELLGQLKEHEGDERNQEQIRQLEALKTETLALSEVVPPILVEEF